MSSLQLVVNSLPHQHSIHRHTLFIHLPALSLHFIPDSSRRLCTTNLLTQPQDGRVEAGSYTTLLLLLLPQIQCLLILILTGREESEVATLCLCTILDYAIVLYILLQSPYLVLPNKLV